MSRIKILFISAITLLILSACGREEVPGSEDRLYIRASAVSPEGESNPATRLSNTGYLVSFEAGDAIGVTGIDANGNILNICNNVRFKYESASVENGLVWASFVNDRGYDFVERVEGATYFAYYPYDPQWNGKTLEYIIEHFDVQANQSTKENFNKSDLMTPTAAIAPSNTELRFTMYHQMSTISIFYNNEWEPDGITPRHSIVLDSSSYPADLRIENTYRAFTSLSTYELRRRYLVNPRKTPKVKLSGYLKENNFRYFSKLIEVRAGTLHSISFEGEPLVPYSDGVDLGLEDVEFVDANGETTTLNHKVIWSKYNLGESSSESYPFDPADGDKGSKRGSRDPYARGDYYCWGATFTQYNNGLSGYNGYGYNNYFDKEYKIAPLGGTIKETEYDVAHAKWWRGKWRLPTENEFRAMYAGCTFEVVATYKESHKRYMGVVGSTPYFDVIKVTSKVNGNFIYMTTGGYFDGTIEAVRDNEGNYTPSGDGKYNSGIVSSKTAYYLSSSASPTILRCISYAYFTATEQRIKIDGSRYTGMLVRPVYSPNEN